MICQLLIYIPTKIVVVRVPFTFLFFIPKLSHRLHSYSIYHNCMIWFSSFSYYRSDVAVPRLLLPRQQYGHLSELITQGWSQLSACGGDGMWLAAITSVSASPWMSHCPPMSVRRAATCWSLRRVAACRQVRAAHKFLPLDPSSSWLIIVLLLPLLIWSTYFVPFPSYFSHD